MKLKCHSFSLWYTLLIIVYCLHITVYVTFLNFFYNFSYGHWNYFEIPPLPPFAPSPTPDLPLTNVWNSLQARLRAFPINSYYLLPPVTMCMYSPWHRSFIAFWNVLWASGSVTWRFVLQRNNTSTPSNFAPFLSSTSSRAQLKCDGTCAETTFRVSGETDESIKIARWGASVQSTAGSRGVRISGSNAGYTVFRGSVKGTGYPLQPRCAHQR